MSKLKEFFGKMFKADISKLKTVNEQKFQTMIDNRGREYIEKVAPPNPKDDAPIIGTLLEAFETAVVSINDETKPVKGIIFKDGKMIIEA